MAGLILAREGRLHERKGGADNFITPLAPGVRGSSVMLQYGLNKLKPEDIADRATGNDEEEEEGEDEEGEYEEGEDGDGDGDGNEEVGEGDGEGDIEEESEDEDNVDDENDDEWEPINEDFWVGEEPESPMLIMAYGKKEFETRAWAERAAKRKLKKQREALKAQKETLAREKETLRAERETLRAEKEALEAQIAEHARDYKCSMKKSVRQAKARARLPAAAGGVRSGRVMKGWGRGAVTLTAASARPRRAGANY